MQEEEEEAAGEEEEGEEQAGRANEHTIVRRLRKAARLSDGAAAADAWAEIRLAFVKKMAALQDETGGSEQQRVTPLVAAFR